MKHTLIAPSIVTLLLLGLLGGCSVLEEDKVNYKSASKGPSLDVPPDLSQLRRDSRYALESTSASASGFAAAGQAVKDAGTAANSFGDVRLERSGDQRWLVVNRPADKVWDSLREFWTSNGFVLTTDEASLGILETDWAENRAKIPQDFIRRSIGKVFDGLYSTGERDRYRTRLERNSTGGVDIYITHRGMLEDYVDAQKTRTVWKPRPSDPELEIEFLRRLMVKLGSPASPVNQVNAPSVSRSGSQVGAGGALLLQDTLDRAWRRTGVALDRSGFTVEDRDRSKGLYFVRYVPQNPNKEEPGFFSRLLGNKATPQSLIRYQIELQAIGPEQTRLRLLNQQGQAETSENARGILQLLATELR